MKPEDAKRETKKDSKLPSQRRSAPKGMPSAYTPDDYELNEERIIRDDGEIVRTSGGYSQEAQPAYDPKRDSGNRASGKSGRGSGSNGGEKPNRRADRGELVD